MVLGQSRCVHVHSSSFKSVGYSVVVHELPGDVFPFTLGLTVVMLCFCTASTETVSSVLLVSLRDTYGLASFTTSLEKFARRLVVNCRPWRSTIYKLQA